MSQNIELLNAQYFDVPGVLLPKIGGGNALFVDVSPTTISSTSDVKKGKIFFDALGNELIGTAQTIDICTIGSSFDSSVTVPSGSVNRYAGIPWSSGSIQTISNPDLFEWNNATAELTIKSLTGNQVAVMFTEDVYGNSTTTLATCGIRVYGYNADGTGGRVAIANGTYLSYRNNLACTGAASMFAANANANNLVYPRLQFQSYLPSNGKFVAPRAVVFVIT